MKEDVLEFLKKEETSYEFSQIMDKLNLRDNIQELTNVLNELDEEGEIFITKRNKYMYFPYCHLKRGKLDVNEKGFGFVITQDDCDDIYINEKNMNGALNNDIVNVEIISAENDPKIEGKILRIVKRDLGNLTGEFCIENGTAYIKLDDSKLKIRVEIDPENYNGAVEGHKVLVKLLKRKNNNKYIGEVARVLGHKNDPKVDILTVAYKHGVEEEFPKEALEELDNIPSIVTEDECKNRKDLREQEIFTIDGDDTKDIDDAISIKKLDNGNYLLGVHIADVTNYIQRGSELDKSALDRGTSVYLANTVIPMLPHYLSNGICSLNPGTNRLTISCVMEINNKGEIINNEIFESVINSKKQMTYKNVNKILEENIVPEGYEQFENTLKLMKECSDILRESKVRRGAIDFDRDEIKVITDENDKPIDIKLRDRGIGEKLIEDFMVAANETIATYVYYLEYPFVYRIHEEPDEEKIGDFLRFVSNLGYQITGKRKDLHPKRIQEMLLELKDKPEYKILSNLLLRSMKKAVYSTNNVGHYGLASERYTHFTSPIRRYPDSTVHRILKLILNGNMTSKEVAYWKQALIYITEHSSEKEQRSKECEREVDDMLSAEYMEDNIGKEYEGMISSITNFGMFIQLDNLVEGLVHIGSLRDDHYIYDDYLMRLVGQNTNKIYKLGDKLNVRVIAASKENRTIDFEIVKEKVLKKNEKGV